MIDTGAKGCDGTFNLTHSVSLMEVTVGLSTLTVGRGLQQYLIILLSGISKQMAT